MVNEWPTLGVSFVPSELEMRRVLCAFPAEAAALAKPKMLPGAPPSMTRYSLACRSRQTRRRRLS
jgi:hypothetical protein